jgi:hypothetical protein
MLVFPHAHRHSKRLDFEGATIRRLPMKRWQQTGVGMGTSAMLLLLLLLLLMAALGDPSTYRFRVLRTGRPSYNHACQPVDALNV